MPKVELSIGALSLCIEQEQEITADYIKSIVEITKMIPSTNQKKIVSDFKVSSESNLTMNTIVNKLNARSLKELLEAGAYFSHLNSSDGIFSKSDWENNSSSALRWDKGMVKNRSTYIKRAIDSGIVIEKPGDCFALSPEFEEKTRVALG